MSSPSSTRRSFAPGKLPAERPGRDGGKRSTNRTQRVQELCQAALELFTERGTEAVTVDEITRRAGVAKGSFYRYFEDKPQLVLALFEPLRLEVEQAFATAEVALAAAKTTTEQVAAYELLTLALARVCLQNPKLVLLYLREARGPLDGARKPVRSLAETVRQRAIELTTTAHQHRLLRDLPPRITAMAVIGSVEALLFEYLDQGQRDDPEVFGATLVSMVLDGLRKR